MSSDFDALKALEREIIGAVETLDRIEEFLVPSEEPDNAGLGVNMCATVPSFQQVADVRRRPLIFSLNFDSAHSFSKADAAQTATHVLPHARSNKFISNLNSIQQAGMNLPDDLEVPTELIEHYVDEGRPLDAYSKEIIRRAEQMSEGLASKQDAFGKLEERLRAGAADLLVEEDASGAGAASGAADEEMPDADEVEELPDGKRAKKRAS